MPSRVRKLLQPRSLGMLLAGLVGGHVASRLRSDPPERTAERLPEPYRFPSPVLGGAIILACALFTAAWFGWVAVSSRVQARAVAVALTGGDPGRAPELIRRYGCGGCHTIPGAPGADGRVAAPLVDMRARVYVAGVLPNAPRDLVRWIVNPPAFSPNTAMPVTGITEAEARDVAAFLYGQ